MELKELQNRMEEMAAVAPAQAAIGTNSEKTGQILRALEFGSVEGQRPWPHPGAKTVLAVNPETGQQVVVSAQAPQGFIRVRAAEFADSLLRELARPAPWLDTSGTQAHLERAVKAAAESALAAIQNSAPRDSGKLVKSLVVATG